MNTTDLKFYAVNALGFSMTLSNIELMVQILIGLVVLGYSLHKWYLMYESNKKDKNDG